MSPVRLDEFCEIRGGGKLGLTGADFVPQGVPAYGAAGVNGWVADVEYRRPGVVLSAIGARCGKCFLADGEWTTLANTQVILPDLNRADVRFIWYQLNDEATWHRSGTAQPFIKPSDVKSRQVHLPPLHDQQRIADLLDRADALRVKRREACALLEDLTRSIFLDMFSETDRRWAEVKVDDVVDRSRGGIRTGPFGSQLLHSEFVDEGVAVLGIDNAVNNAFAWAKQRFITPAKYRELQRYQVQPGDVLITIMGTCGRAAVVPDDIPLAINTKHLCCISLDRSRCLPEYLHAYFLQHPHARRYLERNAKGAIMSGLNMGIIKQMPLQLPPLALQSNFVASLSKLASVKASLSANQRGSETLFESIKQRAFTGQL